MFGQEDGIEVQDTNRPSPRWAFYGRSHTELEDRLLAKIDAGRARERLRDDASREVSKAVQAWVEETLGRLRGG